MGKILLVFLSVFMVVVFGSSDQNPNPESNSTREIISNEFLTKIEELEKFQEEFKEIKSSFVDLSSAFGRFHQYLTKNGTGETGEVSTTTPSTPQEPETENPALKSISSCRDAMEILPSPLSKKQTIYPHGNSTSLKVLCDFEVDGGGWTLIQKRSSGPAEEFNQTWNDYAKGFGLRAGNFWLGLENIHALTKNGDQELRIELEDFQGEKRYAKYSRFSISDASDFYRLAISGFARDSTAGDSITDSSAEPRKLLNGMRFSTRDKDNDLHSDEPSCAQYYRGGWWFNNCGGLSHLNGIYRVSGETFSDYQGIMWDAWKGQTSSLAKTEMKIRKRK